LFQRCEHRVPVVQLHHEEVVDRLSLGPLPDRVHRKVGKSLEVVARDRASRLVPLVEVVELDAEDGRLESIEAAVVSSQLVEIATVTSAVVSELAYSAGELGVVSDDGATVPECAEVLSRVEAEARGMSERTYASPFPACAVGLGCVLDDGDPSPLGDLEDSRHVDRLTVEVH